MSEPAQIFILAFDTEEGSAFESTGQVKLNAPMFGDLAQDLFLKLEINGETYIIEGPIDDFDERDLGGLRATFSYDPWFGYYDVAFAITGDPFQQMFDDGHAAVNLSVHAGDTVLAQEATEVPLIFGSASLLLEERMPEVSFVVESTGKLHIELFTNGELTDSQVLQIEVGGSVFVLEGPFGYRDRVDQAEVSFAWGYNSQKIWVSISGQAFADLTLEKDTVATVSLIEEGVTLHSVALAYEVFSTPMNQVGDIIPHDLTLVDQFGAERRALSDESTELALIELTGLWCAPSIALAENFATYETIVSRHFEVLSFLAHDEEIEPASPADALQFAQTYQMAIPILTGEVLDKAVSLQARLPRFMLVDQVTGEILKTFDGVAVEAPGQYAADQALAALSDIDANLREEQGLEINGADENGRHFGSVRADVITAGIGDDLIDGGMGNDTLLGGHGDDTLSGGLGADLITLGGGVDHVIGSGDELNGDRITDLSSEDAIIVLERALTRDLISFDTESGLVLIGSTQAGDDGISLILEGGFDNGDFMAVATTGGTMVSFEAFLPNLSEGRSISAQEINGIANTAFLKGDGKRAFEITIDAAAEAEYDNAFGIYEIDGSSIVDVRLLTTDASTSAVPLKVAGIETGHELGFFIIQNGAAFAENLTDLDELGFIETMGNGQRLTLNHQLTGETVFHSHAAGWNADGLVHTLSGVTPGGQALTIGFEDMTGGGDRDFQDVLFTVTWDALI